MRTVAQVFWMVVIVAASNAWGEAPGWRGDGTGRFPAAQPPQTWSRDGNVVWKTALPGGGYSSPVLFKGRLYVTAEPSQLLAVDAATGLIAWRGTANYAAALGEEKAAEIEATYARFEAEKKAIQTQYDALRKANPADPGLEPLKLKLQETEDARKEYGTRYVQERRGGAGNAAATPACDEHGVYVVFGAGVVAAFDHQGNRRWATFIEASQIGFGHSTSPVLAGGKLVVHFENLVALDPSTGNEAWRQPLPAKHGTPAAVKIGGQDVLITPSGAFVRAADGRILAEKQFDLSNNSPLVHEGIVYAHESGGVKALRLPAALGEPLALETIWESDSTRDQRMASAVYHQGLLYAAARRGVLDVTDAATGEVLYRQRVDLGDLFPSVVAAGNFVFVSGTDGRTIVLRPGREYEEVAVNEVERFGSTPVFAGKRMYLRTDRTLYCIGE